MVTDNVAGVESEYVAILELFEMFPCISDLLVVETELVFVDDLDVGLGHESVFLIVLFVFHEVEAVVGASVLDGDEK